MADHIALQARDYIVDTTIASLSTVTAANIVKARVYPIQADSLPGIAVNLGACNQEPVSADDGTGVLIQNLQALMFEIYVKDTTTDTPTDLDEWLWDVIKDIEAAMGADASINGLIKFSYPSGISEPQRDEGEVPHAKVTLEYTLEFYHRASAPDVSV